MSVESESLPLSGVQRERSARAAASTSSVASHRVGRWVRQIAREPLLHFFVVGFVILVIAQTQATDSSRRIVVDDSLVARLSASYAQQYGNAPTPRQLTFLTDQHVRQEIQYREGLALGLDVDDEIIRRRVVQKFEFLQQDIAVADEATDAQLQAFYDRHPDQYTVPAKVSFSHVYFSPDKGERAAQLRALHVLELLRQRADGQPPTRAPQRGDRFSDSYDYAATGSIDLRRLFGATPFVKEVFDAPVGQWAGPMRSGFGWHLVFVSQRQPAFTQPFSAVRETVREDFLRDARETANAVAFRKLASQYTIERVTGNDL